MKTSLGFLAALLAVAATAGAVVAALLASVVTFQAPATPPPPSADSRAGSLQGVVVFDPPRPEDAPAELREAVSYGRSIFDDTARLLPGNVGNGLRCSDCHFDGGRAKDGISLVGVAASYPRYRSRTKYATDLVSRTNECFQRSMNGKPLEPASHEMQALVAYYQWISRGLPIYGDIPWLGLRKVEARHAPDAQAGKLTWQGRCAACHAEGGGGTALGPPVWGDRSYNDGAGMHRAETLAAFALGNMPRTAPDLTPEQALDVAAFIAAQPRPRFVGR